MLPLHQNLLACISLPPQVGSECRVPGDGALGVDCLPNATWIFQRDWKGHSDLVSTEENKSPGISQFKKIVHVLQNCVLPNIRCHWMHTGHNVVCYQGEKKKGLPVKLVHHEFLRYWTVKCVLESTEYGSIRLWHRSHSMLDKPSQEHHDHTDASSSRLDLTHSVHPNHPHLRI